MNKAASFLKNIIIGIFLVLIVWINVIIWVYGTSGYQPGTIFSFAFSLGVIWLVGKGSKRFAVLGKGRRRACLCLLLLAYFLMLLYAGFHLWCDVYDTWDHGFLIRTAYELTFHNDILDPVYYARYPNNTMFLQLLCGLCAIGRRFGLTDLYDFLRLTIVVNCALITAAAFFLYAVACAASGYRAGCLVLGLFMASWPVYAYAPILYTDTGVMLPFALSLYLFARLVCGGRDQRAQNRRQAQVRTQVFRSIGIGAVLAIGYRIRASLIIVVISGLIVLLFLSFKEKGRGSVRWWNAPLLLISVLAFSLLLGRICTGFLDQHGVDAALREKESFPVTHWIMMSLNPEKDGGFNDADVKLSASVEGRAAKKALETAQIKERIAAMGIRGTLIHVLHKKVLHQWIYGSYSSSSYLGRKPLNDTWLRQFVAAKGKCNPIYRTITQGWYCALMLLVLLAGFLNRKCDAFSLHLRLIMIGVFLFYLLWEVNARYLLNFHLIFVLLAGEGADLLDKKVYTVRTPQCRVP